MNSEITYINGIFPDAEVFIHDTCGLAVTDAAVDYYATA